MLINQIKQNLLASIYFLKTTFTNNNKNTNKYTRVYTESQNKTKMAKSNKQEFNWTVIVVVVVLRKTKATIIICELVMFGCRCVRDCMYQCVKKKRKRATNKQQYPNNNKNKYWNENIQGKNKHGAYILNTIEIYQIASNQKSN